MSALVKQFNALPRAAKWLIGLGVLVGVFYGAINPLLNFLHAESVKAADLEQAMSADRGFASTEAGSTGEEIRKGQRNYGTPRRPGGARLTPEEFTRVVQGILDGHSIADPTVNEHKVKMTAEQALALGVGDVERIILELSFEAAASDVVAVLADLEKAPAVAAVSRVRIDKGNARDEDQQLVRATMSLEAWIVSSGAGSAPSASSEGAIP